MHRVLITSMALLSGVSIYGNYQQKNYVGDVYTRRMLEVFQHSVLADENYHPYFFQKKIDDEIEQLFKDLFTNYEYEYHLSYNDELYPTEVNLYSVIKVNVYTKFEDATLYSVNFKGGLLSE